MKDIEKAAVERQKLFKRLLTVSVKQVIYGGLDTKTAEQDFLAKFGAPSMNIVHSVLEQASSYDQSAPTFYCGRCMRFFAIDNFNETNAAKARSGEGGYCLQCGSQTLETLIDFSTGNVEYIDVAKSRYDKTPVNGIPDEVKNWATAPSTENLVKAILSVQKKEVKQFYFFEAVVPIDQVENVLAVFNQCSIIKTNDHAIVSAMIQRELTQHEMSLLRNISRSFVYRQMK